MKQAPPSQFLPLCRAEMEARGWDRPDFVYVTGDAYVDHPSFGVAIISRVLEDAGYRVAILAQPDDGFYRARCDYILENNGDLAALWRETDALYTILSKGDQK